MTSRGMHPHPEALYFHIADDASREARATDDEFKRKQMVATAFVFAALCLETYINQEFARHSQTQKVIDEDPWLSLKTKWLILPLLLGAQGTFEKGAQPYQTFHELVLARNQRLVHFKPLKETRVTGEQYDEESFSEFIGDTEKAKRYVQCVADMIQELNRLTAGKTEVPSFLSGAKYTGRVWANANASVEIGPPRQTPPMKGKEGSD